MRESPFIKFCGITNLEDAQLAAKAGADFLGFIFVAGTPRAVEAETVQRIKKVLSQQFQTHCPRFVGVFQNASAEATNQTAELAGLDLIQCHGSETVETLAKLSKSVIKTLTLSEGMNQAKLLAAAEQYQSLSQSKLSCFLLDLPKGSKGISLEEHLTSIVSSRQELLEILRQRPFGLAGNLSADTVPSLIQKWQPTGVDVASSIEISAGKKDPVKMAAFMAAVENALLKG